ncbi:DUF1501 domain-containing protein [Pseudomaricurvus sp. HS19]|uniref:DUF1501 domain-containing protein n=1 Tax=Pseudomaricurvus sp. HS19 TaxID=2692626 RepID=UPI00136DB5C6
MLVLVELNGGNDSLNTVVPLGQLDAYQVLRPQLALQAEERIQLDEQFAVHQSLEALLPVWQSGHMALIHGVGYPQPNRSHFRSIDIWDTASAADKYLNEGWLSGISPIKSAQPVDAVVFGRNAAPVMGEQSRYLKINSLAQFVAHAAKVDAVEAAQANDALSYVASQQNTLFAGAELLVPAVKRAPPLAVEFPASPFGKHLADVARLLKLELGIPVIKVALGSFDTHRNQKTTHARLLKDLAEGLAAFSRELQIAGLWDRVAIMTYSEFGRRAAQNGSGGSDHGTAATHFVMGGAVRGGHIGEHPDLTALVDQDMQYTTDFRSVYQTILSDWCGQSGLTVGGAHWPTLPLFRSV